jgi:hypothetical protein
MYSCKKLLYNSCDLMTFPCMFHQSNYKLLADKKRETTIKGRRSNSEAYNEQWVFPGGKAAGAWR